MLDLYLHYNYIGRFILNLKQSKIFLNFKEIIKIFYLIIYFNIKEITDINSFSFLNNIYFFKFYFGVLPFFSNYKSIFRLNINHFSFIVQYKFKNKKIYFPLFFFLNDIYSKINKIHLSILKKNIFWEFNISDMNFFIEKKNSSGFFYLKHNISFKILLNNIKNYKDLDLFFLFKLKN